MSRAAAFGAFPAGAGRAWATWLRVLWERLYERRFVVLMDRIASRFDARLSGATLARCSRMGMLLLSWVAAPAAGHAPARA
jgi:hypothetical protein